VPRRRRGPGRPVQLAVLSAGGSGAYVVDAGANALLRVNNIEVVTYFDAATPSTMADVHGMEQVFLNLLNNSIQSIGSGTRRGVITIGVVAVDERIRVSFTDDGPGIPPDVMPRIFKPFFTTKPTGTGLGLAICKEIADFHKARLSLSNRPSGPGTVARIEFPDVLDQQDVGTALGLKASGE
jgi:two-component system, sporulation sensor kinase A